MSLTIEQQKELYDKLYDRIIDIHSVEFKNELIKYTEDARTRGSKGILLIDYSNITDMIQSVKTKSFNYEWISQKDAAKIKHTGLQNALLTMNTKRDCVLVCSLSISLKHLYINCVKFRDVNKP